MKSSLKQRIKSIGKIAAVGAILSAGVAMPQKAEAQQTKKKPNIVVIFGDDIGQSQVSAYSHGMMGYRTTNIDRLYQEGVMFTDAYGQQSCTAGRAAFILGQEPFRTGLLTIGMPGDDHGITDWMPTIADVMKSQGYATGQFGKNHLGDQDKHLPTKHGFDEFFGNLYHLNAEEEPEGYFYPKDTQFRKTYGPRGVLRSTADGKVEDTGPLTSKRMETIDDEFFASYKDFVNRQAKADKPFFIWFNTTRMHVFTHLKPASVGLTGKGIEADGMKETDNMIGELLKQLDDLGIADNTIVVYTTDNGGEMALWPDGGVFPFKGEKGTTWEGGFRIPMLMRWPGVIKPQTQCNEIISLIDLFPTLCAAAGIPDIKEQMAKGWSGAGKSFKVHLDGYNFLPYLQGKVNKGPRENIMYFDQAGNLNAVRWNDWKVTFAYASEGNIATSSRVVPAWGLIANLRMDPYERGQTEGGKNMEFAGQQMWLLVPIQQQVKQFFADFEKYPYQTGSTLNPSGVSYTLLKQQEAMQRLKELETLKPH